MKLGELVAGIGAVEGGSKGPGAEGVEIGGLAYDSRKVASGVGVMYCCVPGERYDGHEFAKQAVADGARALLVQRRLGLGVPEVLVGSVRAAMGSLAARVNGDPTSKLKVVGVTGTNGKTTSAYLVRALLEASGVRTGLLGTVTSIVGGQERATDWRSTESPIDQRTTPEAIDLQRDFREMLEKGDGACAMEVSSHALAMGRTNGIEWAGAVYTNLTQDHLDYHPSMEDYYRAKRRLFLPDPDLPNAWPGKRPGVSVINVGDSYGRRLAGEVGEGAVTFAVEGEADDGGDADYRATEVRADGEGCRFVLHVPGGKEAEGGREARLGMVGRFNVENAVGALAVVHELGGDLDKLLGVLEEGVRVPGRFEPVEPPEPGDASGESSGDASKCSDDVSGGRVIVDYAHTPDSLENVLRAAREIARGRVICVFGAGGDRDRGKRAPMGEVAARLADVAVVTSDNPRSESPEGIVEEIVKGIPSRDTGKGADGGEGGEVHVEVDRRKAIEWAIEGAEGDDMVVIAGKGHEQGQELAGGVKVPFDDRVVAKEALRAKSERVVAGAGR